MEHSNAQIRCEALWVVCNAVNSAETDHLKVLYDQKSSSLIQPMTDALLKDNDHQDLVMAILNALLTLLKLDVQFTHAHFNSVSFTIQSVSGIDTIYQMS